MTTDSLEQILRGEVEQKYAKYEGSIKKAYELLISIYAEMSFQEIRKFIAKGISFWIFKGDIGRNNNGERHYNVYAVKFLSSYEVMVKTTNVVGA